MTDRTPTYPGRVTLTPVSGQANTYDMVRADEPTQTGTPLNKSTLLTDSTATALGLTSDDPTVDEALKVVRPLALGGTGQTTAAKALYALINGSSALTGSTIATGDYFALGDVSTATGKKITLANLLTYFLTYGMCRIATGSYVGTGTYGSSNPCSLTFSFTPRILIIENPFSTGTTTTVNGYSNVTPCIAINGQTEGFLWITRSSTDERSYFTWSGTTVSWYTNASSADMQLNSNGTTYHYVAIG